MQPTITALSLEITDDLVHPPVTSTPGVVGALALPFSEDVVLAVVKGLVEGLAQNFGDSFNDLVLTQRDRIRKIVGPIALRSLDELVHGLQD